MKKIKYLLLLLPIVLLPGCMGGGEFPLDRMVANPIIQVMIGIVVLWLVFKSWRKGG